MPRTLSSGTAPLPPIEKIRLGALAILILLLLLPIMVSLGLRARWEVWGSYWVAESEWRKAPGTILDLKFFETQGRSSSTVVKAKYSYTVKGKVYQGNRIAFDLAADDWARGYEGRKEVFEKYSASKNVIVYYLPADPSFSVLEPEVNFTPIVEGVFVLGYALCLLYAFSMFVTGLVAHFSRSSRQPVVSNQVWSNEPKKSSVAKPSATPNSGSWAYNMIQFHEVCPACKKRASILADTHIAADHKGADPDGDNPKTYRIGEKMEWWERKSDKYPLWREGGHKKGNDWALECCSAECGNCGEHIFAVIRFERLMPASVVEMGLEKDWPSQYESPA